MGGRLQAGEVQLGKLLHVVDDLPELRLQPGKLLLVEVKARKPRHVLDLFPGNHRAALLGTIRTAATAGAEPTFGRRLRDYSRKKWAPWPGAREEKGEL